MSGTLWPRIMLTGKNGQVGWELQRTLAPLGEVVALDRQQLDLANPDQIRERIREIKPNLIVNAAAYTAVDKAEEEPELAMAINGIAPGILAEEAKRLNAAIIHYSTDYVFDGTKTTPYTEEDVPNPLNVYGKTKLEGERAINAIGVPHLILRTSWVYGLRGRNFLLTILRLAAEREELRIVSDQVGAPTWSRIIAEVTSQMLVRCYTPNINYPNNLVGKEGIYHLTAGGETSWYGFAKEFLAMAPSFDLRVKRLIKIPTSQYPTAACRPLFSVLSNLKLYSEFGLTMPSWDQTLAMVMEKYDG
ncbi:MAG: dTDP-4-dehydrorhamnose reductase [Eubacteriales bacterium]|nr:dTDP-4-dehydrorhamnose reductase [Eubacteriales bacterium]